jgi:hypothetical protein
VIGGRGGGSKFEGRQRAARDGGKEHAKGNGCMWWICLALWRGEIDINSSVQ